MLTRHAATGTNRYKSQAPKIRNLPHLKVLEWGSNAQPEIMSSEATHDKSALPIGLALMPSFRSYLSSY